MGKRFDDGKEAGALRTIGELGKALGLKPHVLRYWEEQFPMLSPLKRSGGRRYYRSKDIELVETIDRLVNEEGYTLKGARAAIEGGKCDMANSGDPRFLTARDLPRDEPVHQPAARDSLNGDGRSAPVRARAAQTGDRASALAELKAIRQRLTEALDAS